jgi:hypothetical protein
MEAMIAPLNELIQANFVLMKYRSYGGVRQGEMQMTGGGSPVAFNLENPLRLLKEKDFDRALELTNGFHRIETRLWLQMTLIDDNSTGSVMLPVGTRFSKMSLS